MGHRAPLWSLHTHRSASLLTGAGPFAQLAGRAAMVEASGQQVSSESQLGSQLACEEAGFCVHVVRLHAGIAWVCGPLHANCARGGMLERRLASLLASNPGCGIAQHG